MLRVENTGQQHAQLADLVLADAAGNPIESANGLIGYVLAGQSRQIPISSLPAATAEGTVEVSVNGAKVIAPVSLAQPGQ